MAAIDDYATFSPAGPGIHVCRNAAAVTPNDGADLSDVSQSIVVGVAGNVAMVLAGNGATVTVPFIAGVPQYFAASRIMATNTTATGIVVGW